MARPNSQNSKCEQKVTTKHDQPLKCFEWMPPVSSPEGLMVTVDVKDYSKELLKSHPQLSYRRG